MPMTANKADVVVSNCVLNLVPDKVKAFSEIYRILKPGGHLSVSDVVIKGELPQQIQEAAEMYAGCVAGAIQIEDYLNIMAEAGLKNIQIFKEKVIQIPDEVMLNFLKEDELEAFRKTGADIISITVYAEKPVSEGCGCGCGCN